MGFVTLTELLPGQPRDADVVNANFQAIEDESTNLQTPNFRDEGLDFDAFSSSTASQRQAWQRKFGTTLATASNTTTAVPTLGGTQMRIDNTSGFNIPVGERMRVRAALYFPSTAGGVHGIPLGTRVDLELWQSQSATPVFIGGTRRWAGDILSDTGGGIHRGLRTFAWLEPGTYDWVEMRVGFGVGTGTYRMNYASLIAPIIKRIG